VYIRCIYGVYTCITGVHIDVNMVMQVYKGVYTGYNMIRVLTHTTIFDLFHVQAPLCGRRCHRVSPLSLKVVVRTIHVTVAPLECLPYDVTWKIGDAACGVNRLFIVC